MVDKDIYQKLSSFRKKAFITSASINHILKSLKKQADLSQIGKLSGHSFRVGAVIDLLDKKNPLEKLCLVAAVNQKLMQ